MSDELTSVFHGKDNALLNLMFAFYAPEAETIIDVCCNERRMWKGTVVGEQVKGYDIDPQWQPDEVCSWNDMPDCSGTVDVLVYDPPHLPQAAASPKSLKRYGESYGLGLSTNKDNIGDLHPPFLEEANRVLKKDGLIFAKIKDYIHNHKYQWNLELFNAAVRKANLTPCDLIIKQDPCGGNLRSGRWKTMVHVKNKHCYWVVVRKGRCEPKRKPLTVSKGGRNDE